MVLDINQDMDYTDIDSVVNDDDITTVSNLNYQKNVATGGSTIGSSQDQGASSSASTAGVMLSKAKTFLKDYWWVVGLVIALPIVGIIIWIFWKKKKSIRI